MGKRGPPPTPTVIKRMRGSQRADADSPNQPTPQRGRPKCPGTLNPAEKVVWRKMATQLDNMQVLTVADEAALARYCQFRVLFDEARELFEGKYDADDTTSILRLAMEAVRATGTLVKLSDHLIKLEREFGLTPSARTRISVAAQQEKEDEPEARFLRIG